MSEGLLQGCRGGRGKLAFHSLKAIEILLLNCAGLVQMQQGSAAGRDTLSRREGYTQLRGAHTSADFGEPRQEQGCVGRPVRYLDDEAPTMPWCREELKGRLG